ECRMHDSGFKETLHKTPSSHQPVCRPSRNSKVSPMSMADNDASRTKPSCSGPLALLPPAKSKAKAAGTGRPMASAKTRANSMEYPCCEMFDNKTCTLLIDL